jgi:membrane protease subunit HflK
MRSVPDRYDWTPRRDPQDPLAELRQVWERLRQRVPSSGSGGPRISPWPILAIALVLYLASGIYIVNPDQVGVVLRFGKVARETGPGPHYHLPWPIESVLRPSVTTIRKEEFGFRTISQGPPARFRAVNDEALMLTGDENIIKLDFIVQFRVRPDTSGPTDYLFNVRDPDTGLRASAEAAMREVIGRTPIESALTDGKDKVQQDMRELLQAILDRYGAGIEIVAVQLQDVGPPDQVSDAFKDVISAQQDRERMVNEARGYANDVVPKARGQAAQLLNEAEGYRQATVRDATGAAQRFIALHEAYSKSKDVTRRRLYLETMEDVLPKVNKILLDDASAQRVVPYLPLGRAQRGETLE